MFYETSYVIYKILYTWHACIYSVILKDFILIFENIHNIFNPEYFPRYTEVLMVINMKTYSVSYVFYLNFFLCIFDQYLAIVSQIYLVANLLSWSRG